MKGISDTAMILAAGFGMRMRPLSLQKPKPLLEVGGRTMLDLALDKLAAAGIRRAVVNAFYLAEQIEAHLKAAAMSRSSFRARANCSIPAAASKTRSVISMPFLRA